MYSFGLKSSIASIQPELAQRSRHQEGIRECATTSVKWGEDDLGRVRDLKFDVVLKGSEKAGAYEL